MSRGIIITYKNSGFATFVSIVGSVLLFSGLGVLFYVAWYIGVVMLLMGGSLMFGASHIAKRAGFKKWVKKLKADGIIDAISDSESLCIQMYQANPSKRTLELIRNRNPQAAEYIATFIATKK